MNETRPTCRNGDCNQGRECPARAQQAMPLRGPVWLLATAACAAFWWLLYAQFGIVGAVGTATVFIVGIALAVVSGAMERYLPPEDGDTHAGFPPPTRTADARLIEQQTQQMLDRAQREAAHRQRLAQVLQQRQLRASYDARRRELVPPADLNGPNGQV